MVSLLQKRRYLTILSVATPHLRVQIYHKILSNTIEGPHVLLNAGISVLRNYTGTCGPYPKARRQPWHIRTGPCNQRNAVIPSSQTEETKEQNKGICLFQCKKGKRSQDYLMNCNILHKVRERCFFVGFFFFLYKGDFLLS